MALVVVTYHWGSKYSRNYVDRLRAGIARHLKEDHRFLVITDKPTDGQLGIPEPDTALTKVKGCFARLRLFDPLFQENIEIVCGKFDRLVCMDLDAVVTGPLDPLFARADNFTILTGANAANPCPYNGSVWMFRAGYRPDVWSDFSLDAAAKVPFYEFPDDQAWLAYKLPNVVGWKVGPHSGIYAFKKPGWPLGNDLPSDTRLVVFPGHRDPAQFQHLLWIKEHWQ